MALPRNEDGCFTHQNQYLINPFKPEFTIVIFIHYKPRIAVAILDGVDVGAVDGDDLI